MPQLLSLNSYHYRRGGSDVMYFEHDSLFKGIGWNTAVMSMHHPKNEFSPWSAYFVDELEFGHSYSTMDKLRKASKVVYSLEAQRNLSRLLNAFEPDVVHAHCIYHHLSPSVLPLLKRMQLPTIMTAHDLKVACPAYKMYSDGAVCERCKRGNVLNVAFRRCIKDSFITSALVAVEAAVHRLLDTYKAHLNKLVVPSLFFKQKLLEWGWSADQLVLIRNFVDFDHAPNYSPGRYFLYFGRLSSEKGVHTLIEAAAKAKSKLVIAGTGPEEEKLKQLARTTGCDAEFLGYRSGEDLWSLVRGARMVVLPSEWYENNPMSILEAFALGTPAIGARIGGIPELVLPNETGYLFDSGDVEGLTQTLAHAATVPNAVLEEFAKTGHSLVKTLYSKQRYLDNMLDLYRSVGVRC